MSLIKVILSHFPSIILGCLATGISHAKMQEPIHHETRYLDPSIWEITVKESDCFLAAPQSLMQVEPVLSENGERVYKIRQYSDPALAKKLYEQPLEEQIKNHKIVGREFCNGIVSTSNLDLPFSKNENTIDENDGLSLIDKASEDMIDEVAYLEAMYLLAENASRGNYTWYELQDLNDKFQSYKNLIQQIAIGVKFNGIPIHTKVNPFRIPVSQDTSFITLPILNLTTGIDGLNIATLDIASNSNAQSAYSSMIYSIHATRNNLLQLDSARAALKIAIENDASVTTVNVTTDDYLAQHQKLSLTARSTNHS